MKLITAFIQPFMLNKVTRALRQSGITSFSVTEIQGASPEQIGDADYLSKKVRIDIAISDQDTDRTTRLILQKASTHQPGDGLILVQELCAAINIDTGIAIEEPPTKSNPRVADLGD
ncbi:MAG: P-II family nitrogen regulator [Candidatus Obscuribacterales bacterium]